MPREQLDVTQTATRTLDVAGGDRDEAAPSRMRRAAFVAELLEERDEPIHDAVRLQVRAAIGADHWPDGFRGDASTDDLVSAEGTQKKRFTLDRDTATANDAVDLMGLDHPLIQQELGRWRSLPPEQLGVALSGGEVGRTLLSLWLVETATGTQGWWCCEMLTFAPSSNQWIRRDSGERTGRH